MAEVVERKFFQMELSADLSGYEQGFDVANTMLEAFHQSAEAILAATEAEAEAVKSKTMTSLKAVLAIANIAIGTVQAVVNILGMQLDPLHQLVLDIIATSVSAAITIAYGVFGNNPYTLALAVAMATMSTIGGINAAAAAYTGRLRQQQIFIGANVQLIQAGEHIKAGMSMFNGM